MSYAHLANIRNKIAAVAAFQQHHHAPPVQQQQQQNQDQNQQQQPPVATTTTSTPTPSSSIPIIRTIPSFSQVQQQQQQQNPVNDANTNNAALNVTTNSLASLNSGLPSPFFPVPKTDANDNEINANNEQAPSQQQQQQQQPSSTKAKVPPIVGLTSFLGNSENGSNISMNNTTNGNNETQNIQQPQQRFRSNSLSTSNLIVPSPMTASMTTTNINNNNDDIMNIIRRANSLSAVQNLPPPAPSAPVPPQPAPQQQQQVQNNSMSNQPSLNNSLSSNRGVAENNNINNNVNNNQIPTPQQKSPQPSDRIQQISRRGSVANMLRTHAMMAMLQHQQQNQNQNQNQSVTTPPASIDQTSGGAVNTATPTPLNTLPQQIPASQNMNNDVIQNRNNNTNVTFLDKQQQQQSNNNNLMLQPNNSFMFGQSMIPFVNSLDNTSKIIVQNNNNNNIQDQNQNSFMNSSKEASPVPPNPHYYNQNINNNTNSNSNSSFGNNTTTNNNNVTAFQRSSSMIGNNNNLNSSSSPSSQQQQQQQKMWDIVKKHQQQIILQQQQRSDRQGPLPPQPQQANGSFNNNINNNYNQSSNRKQGGDWETAQSVVERLKQQNPSTVTPPQQSDRFFSNSANNLSQQQQPFLNWTISGVPEMNSGRSDLPENNNIQKNTIAVTSSPAPAPAAVAVAVAVAPKKANNNTIDDQTTDNKFHMDTTTATDAGDDKPHEKNSYKLKDEMLSPVQQEQQQQQIRNKNSFTDHRNDNDDDDDLDATQKPKKSASSSALKQLQQQGKSENNLHVDPNKETSKKIELTSSPSTSKPSKKPSKENSAVSPSPQKEEKTEQQQLNNKSSKLGEQDKKRTNSATKHKNNKPGQRYEHQRTDAEKEFIEQQNASFHNMIKKPASSASDNDKQKKNNIIGDESNNQQNQSGIGATTKIKNSSPPRMKKVMVLKKKSSPGKQEQDHENANNEGPSPSSQNLSSISPIRKNNGESKRNGNPQQLISIPEHPVVQALLGSKFSSSIQLHHQSNINNQNNNNNNNNYRRTPGEIRDAVLRLLAPNQPSGKPLVVGNVKEPRSTANIEVFMSNNNNNNSNNQQHDRSRSLELLYCVQTSSEMSSLINHGFKGLMMLGSQENKNTFTETSPSLRLSTSMFLSLAHSRVGHKNKNNNSSSSSSFAKTRTTTFALCRVDPGRVRFAMTNSEALDLINSSSSNNNGDNNNNNNSSSSILFSNRAKSAVADTCFVMESGCVAIADAGRRVEVEALVDVSWTAFSDLATPTCDLHKGTELILFDVKNQQLACPICQAVANNTGKKSVVAVGEEVVDSGQNHQHHEVPSQLPLPPSAKNITLLASLPSSQPLPKSILAAQERDPSSFIVLSDISNAAKLTSSSSNNNNNNNANNSLTNHLQCALDVIVKDTLPDSIAAHTQIAHAASRRRHAIEVQFEIMKSALEAKKNELLDQLSEQERIASRFSARDVLTLQDAARHAANAMNLVTSSQSQEQRQQQQEGQGEKSKPSNSSSALSLPIDQLVCIANAIHDTSFLLMDTNESKQQELKKISSANFVRTLTASPPRTRLAAAIQSLQLQQSKNDQNRMSALEFESQFQLDSIEKIVQEISDLRFTKLLLSFAPSKFYSSTASNNNENNNGKRSSSTSKNFERSQSATNERMKSVSIENNNDNNTSFENKKVANGMITSSRNNNNNNKISKQIGFSSQYNSMTEALIERERTESRSRSVSQNRPNNHNNYNNAVATSRSSSSASSTMSNSILADLPQFPVNSNKKSNKLIRSNTTGNMQMSPPRRGDKTKKLFLSDDENPTQLASFQRSHSSSVHQHQHNVSAASLLYPPIAVTATPTSYLLNNNTSSSALTETPKNNIVVFDAPIHELFANPKVIQSSLSSRTIVEWVLRIDDPGECLGIGASVGVPVDKILNGQSSPDTKHSCILIATSGPSKRIRVRVAVGAHGAAKLTVFDGSAAVSGSVESSKSRNNSNSSVCHGQLDDGRIPHWNPLANVAYPLASFGLIPGKVSLIKAPYVVVP